jgi:uncharacterized YigZ family protein
MNTIKDTYQTIAQSSQGLYKEKGSRFLSFAFPVQSETDIKHILKDLRKQYFDARHHVYAWRLGLDDNQCRANDDGEPANSSGMPILGQIRSYELSDILIVVIRYFGGTKLGVPGLINAYKTAAKEAIEQNSIITKTVKLTYRVEFEYIHTNIVMRKLKEHNFESSAPQFTALCYIDFFVPLSNEHTIQHLFDEYQGIHIQHIQ